jgi:hypothetical protein
LALDDLDPDHAFDPQFSNSTGLGRVGVGAPEHTSTLKHVTSNLPISFVLPVL